MKTLTRTATGLVVGALLLTGCGSSDSSSSSTTKAEKTTTTAASLQIDDVWARQSPMGTSAGAVYLQITSPIDDELVGASVPTDTAGTTEIHETPLAEGDDSSTTEAMGDDAMSTTTKAMGDDAMSTTTEAMGDDSATTTTTAMGGGDDSMTMRPVESIELPAGKTVKLEPGGYHIMLLELAKPLEVGQTFDVTLSFKMAGDRTVTAEVREG